jgi:Leucine-rich repeat (LRR) protein
MFYSVDGKIVKLENGFPQRKVKSLTYEVQGSWFPQSYYNYNNDTNTISGNEYITFTSLTPNSVVINYGDGTVVTKQFELVGNEYKVGYQLGDETPNWVIPQHTFQDGNSGRRKITFEFEKPLSLSQVVFQFIELRGSLPIEMVEFTAIERIRYSFAQYVDNIPIDFPLNLDYLQYSRITQNKLTKLPDGVFSSNLRVISASNTFNLSNHIESNLYKINQLKTSLEELGISYCDLQSLPNEISELINLKFLDVSGNKFNSFPTEALHLQNLYRFYIGNTTGFLDDIEMPFFYTPKLSTIWIGFRNIDLFDLNLKWQNLKSLRKIHLFESFVHTNARFDEFINSFYTLCTNEANITEDPNAFGGEYPHRFRDISWGHSSLAFTGTKQAPQGYIQGVSNGTPANEGEKVYVLQNQYGHTITHA